jgi:hypothetical protein
MTPVPRPTEAEKGSGLANVEGGILAWAEEIDPSVPKY